jgi:CubicO group peptidase (beta-lactamase class C family)
MKLAHEGRIDLERDVRPLVPNLEWNPAHDEAITPVDLLTHGSGLDVTDIGDAAREPARMLSLEAYLTSHMTPQVSRPGRFFRYTNHGYALLGYLAEVVSGQPFPAVARAAIFDPLRMRSSTFEQPLPAALQARVAYGYEWRDGMHHSLGFDYSNVAPADALVTTADDMAKLVLALLEPNDRVLPRESLARMRLTRLTMHPMLPGRALGFREELVGAHRDERGPRRLLSHTGGQLGFTSELVLFPEQRLGLFVVQNLRDYRLRYAVVDAFLTEFFPAKTPAPVAASVPDGTLARLAGRYQKLPYPASTLEGVGGLLAPELVEVSRTSGTLQVAGRPELVPVADTLFVSRDGKTSVAFRVESDGAATHVFVDGEPYERIAWYQSARAQLMVLLGSLLIALAGAIAWPIARWIRRRRTNERAIEKNIGRIAAGVCALTVFYAVLFLVALQRAAAAGGFDYGLPPVMAVALWFPILLGLASIAALAATVFAWKRGYFGWGLRVLLAITTLSPILILAIAYRWHLIGV